MTAACSPVAVIMRSCAKADAHPVAGHCALQKVERNSSSFCHQAENAQLMLCCCAQVRLWNTDTGHCAQVYEHQQNQVSSCAWQPDSRRFVVGTADRCISHCSHAPDSKPSNSRAKHLKGPNNACLTVKYSRRGAKYAGLQVLAVGAQDYVHV